MALKKSEKNLLIGLGVVVVLGGIVMYNAYRPREIETVEGDPTAETTEAPAKATATSKSRPSATSSSGRGSSSSSGGSSSNSAPQLSVVNIDDFESHNQPTDCWVLIDGKVYDISNYLAKIPDASEAIHYCGTLAFEEGFLDETSSTKDSVIQNSTLKGTIG